MSKWSGGLSVLKGRRRRSEVERFIAVINDRPCKYCLACKSWQPLDGFYRDRAKTDGRGSYCKTCQNAKARR